MGHRKVGLGVLSIIATALAVVFGVLAIILEGTPAGKILFVLQLSIVGTYGLSILILAWKRRQRNWKP